MNVQVENLPNCITTLRVEVPPDKVSQAWETIAGDYARYARIPGYRAGKAPRAIVEKKFQKEIREELQKKLLSESCREAIAEKNLRVISISQIEDVEITADKTMRFTASLVTAPEFEVPDYKSISVQVEPDDVTDAEVNDSIENLRNQAADFIDVTDRELQMEDFAVIDFTGTIGGKPIQEVHPSSPKTLHGNKDFWINVKSGQFLPGFCEQLVGAKTGENRVFEIDAPEDLPAKELAGKKLGFNVTIKTIKQRQLPELNDEFAAKIIPGKTMAELREIVKQELQKQKQAGTERKKRDQVMSHLLSKVECELPQNFVRNETRRILAEIVKENQMRGVTDELLKENEKQIMETASQGARERLKGTFILLRIAEAEKIAITREEFKQRIDAMAARYGMTPDKVRKELEKNGALDQVSEEILTAKVLDFLVSNANVQTSAPA